MTEPKRLLDHEATRGLERKLLEVGAGVRLSPDRKAALWQAIEAKLPPPPGDGSGGSSGDGGEGEAGPPSIPLSQAGIPSPIELSGAKLSAGLGLLMALGGAGYFLLASPPGPGSVIAPASSVAAQPASASPSAPAASAIAPASPASDEKGAAPPAAKAPPPQPASREAVGEGASPSRPSAPEPLAAATAAASAPLLPPGSTQAEATAPSASPAPSAAPPASASASPAPSSALDAAQQERVNLLREEAEMTRAARAALRSGSAGEALRLLEQARVKFGGRGGLQQEREALTIEALGRSGQREAARARAQAFLKAFPSSPHAPDVQLFAQ